MTDSGDASLSVARGQGSEADSVEPLEIPPVATGQLSLLLVEDDPGDAYLIGELLELSGHPMSIRVVDSVRGALVALGDAPDCVLLDLGLPDSIGIDAVRAIRRAAPTVPVVVLTGLADDATGREAVAAGAQDYLVKGEASGDAVARAVRYSVGRQEATESLRRLAETELLADENRRMERGLLPTPWLQDDSVVWETVYRAGRQQALLGGDFLDVVERDGVIHLVIGDVAGHGPDEAALGVSLRVAFRALIMSGAAPDEVLPVMSQVLAAEKGDVQWRHVFATACYVVVDRSRKQLDVRLAGHPAPFVFTPQARQLQDLAVGVPLGIFDDVSWECTTIDLPDLDALLLVTDGLLEGFSSPGGIDRLGEEGLLTMLRVFVTATDCHLEQLVLTVSAANGGPLGDDAAAVLLCFANSSDASIEA